MRRRILSAFCVFLLSASGFDVPAQPTSSAKEPSNRVFRAGAAASNTTPFLGGGIVGGWNTPPATHIHDELHARCLVLDDGRTKLAIVLCDLVGISRSVVDEAKRQIQEATGLPPESVLIAATHTHSATSAQGSNRFAMAQTLDDYQQFVARRIADGVRRAINQLEPARIAWGSGSEPGQLFNRRWKMKPGTPLPNPFGGTDRVLMNPGNQNPNLLEPAGPVDPEIFFVSVQALDGRPIAVLANYSLHYVGGIPNGHISADYFGVFARHIGELLGASRQDPPFVGIMSNGTSGDVNNINFAAPREKMEPYEKMTIVGNVVAAEVYKRLQTVKYHDWVPLQAIQRDIQLKVRKPTPELLERARQILARPKGASPTHIREEDYARRTLLLAEYPDELAVPLQAMRIGELGIAAIPCEVFTETGLELKAKSPFQQSFTIELANGSYGYLPTPPQHRLGGYETWLGTSRLEEGASVKIVETLLQMFGTMTGPVPSASAGR